MIDDKKYAFKTKFEAQQELERYKQSQKLKNSDITKYNNFGFYDFLFFFIVVIVSILCKVLNVGFQ
ncbi:MAG: hypothetical protein DI529_06905 [Chryseobacterium sp.]|nr:MAG: hypothetical protein DI529_06905 [Chryseobacterium sp.]